MTAPPRDPDTAEALRALGKRHVVLVLHDPSFPASPGEELGHGSPYSREAKEFVAWAHGIGCNGLQLGPQGRTSPRNTSPYDASLFSRNEMAASLEAMRADPLFASTVDERIAAPLLQQAAGAVHRTDHTIAHAAWQRILDAAFARPRAAALTRALEAFVAANHDWLAADAAPASVERHAFGQLLRERQHAAWKQWLGELGMSVWGDLQIGYGPTDAARFHRVFMRGYLLGAPPSRTNPAGQPWGYPVLDPDTYHDGPDPETSAIALLRARLRRMAVDYDGVRVDHPHGLVCPWVYRGDTADPLAAVQNGARLFSSPALPDHAELARFSRVRPEQLNTHGVRHADDWVVDLDDAQVAAYSVLFDAIVANAPRQPDGRPALVCEVLSTQPHPLRRVLERHGLGRYRVTQKANPLDERDVYRSENARPEDWIMVGNHDTPSTWRVARGWQGTPRGAAEADLLARRLRPGEDPAPLANTLRTDVGAFVHAKVADAFASRAENVKLFFTDLLGLDETYNEPGTVGPHNWSLRVPPDWRRHGERARAGTALDLRKVLALALRIRDVARDHGELITRLETPAPRG